LIARREAMTPEERDAEDRAERERREEESRRYAAERDRRQAEFARIAAERERIRVAAERKRHREIAARGRTFGVEMELHFPYDVDDGVIADALLNAGIECEANGYNHNVSDSWKVVSDASVEEGWEIVSPPLHWDQRDQVTKVCRALESLGGYAERDCGLHVHHDVSDLNVTALKRLARLWHDAQPMTDLLVSPDRCGFGVDWSEPFDDRSLARLLSAQSKQGICDAALDIGRYRALNYQALERYGTVEVRQHQGSCDPEEILAWVAYGQAMVVKAASTPGRVSRKTGRRKPASSPYVLLDSTLPIKCPDSKALLQSKAEYASTLGQRGYRTMPSYS
jgi:hypothetical protein